MRKISSFDAKHCEDADNDKCRCRCGGVLHGKSHQSFISKEAEFVEANGKDALDEKVVARLVGEVVAANKKKGRKAKGG